MILNTIQAVRVLKGCHPDKSAKRVEREALRLINKPSKTNRQKNLTKPTTQTVDNLTLTTARAVSGFRGFRLIVITPSSGTWNKANNTDS